jgi:hypothetical protein
MPLKRSGAHSNLNAARKNNEFTSQAARPLIKTKAPRKMADFKRLNGVNNPR